MEAWKKKLNILSFFSMRYHGFLRAVTEKQKPKEAVGSKLTHSSSFSPNLSTKFDGSNRYFIQFLFLRMSMRRNCFSLMKFDGLHEAHLLLGIFKSSFKATVR